MQSSRQLKIKICGLQREADVEAVNKYRPDWAGFVFAPGRHCVTAEQARRLRASLRKDIPVLGVFVQAPVAFVANLAQEGIIDGIQLHGDEDELYVEELRQQTTVPLWRACRIRPGQTDCRFPAVQKAGHLILDAFSVKSYGGTGRRIDPVLLQQVKVDKPFLLAGGLNADNVEDAVRTVVSLPQLAPYFAGVDVSGGVETEGVKDAQKIKDIIGKVRGMRL